MPQDLCHSAKAPARTPQAPALAPIVTLLLAALVVAALAPAPPAENTTAQPPIPEDWHGNVMRSHWTGAGQPR
ncbi:hypothetical protein [Roseovarius mucosus]|uniref:hypothetical protein n=1 Tax=Roseovarius mucosus TaxID=215743 RepID=UPI0035CEF505